MDQEQLFKLQVIEQEANQINQQLEVIEQNIIEMHELESSLDELDKKENNEFLANLGKKIFIPVQIKEKKLVVEVGQKNFVKKTIPETKEIVQDQLEKLSLLREQLAERVDNLQNEMQNLIIEINSSNQNPRHNPHNHNHSHNHNCKNKNCNCEDECTDCKCEKE